MMTSPHAPPDTSGRADRRPLRARAAWWLLSVCSDLRHACAISLRQGRFTIFAVAILGIGTGAIASLAVVFENTVLNSWPVGDPSSLFTIRAEPSPGERYGYVSFAECRYFDEHAESLGGATAWGRNGALVTKSVSARPALIELHYVPANYFSLLRAGLVRGRGFHPGDEIPGAEPVAIISYRLWREAFARDESILGRVIHVYNLPVVVVGVAVPGFVGTDDQGPVDLWLPLSTWDVLFPGGAPRGDDPRSPATCVARLRDGVSLAAATGELRALSARFRRSAAIAEADVFLSTSADAGVSSGRPRLRPMVAVFAALLVVLLVVCVNVGNILLAKGFARAPEIELRLALGATPARMVRQLLTESLVLSFAAGTVGLIVSSVLPPVAWHVLGLQPGKPGLSYLGPAVAFDLRPGVFAFAFAMSLGVAAATGLAPALSATRVGAARNDGQRTAARKRGLRQRSRMLALQVSVTTALLVIASLLARTAARSANIDAGFPASGVTTIAIQLPTRGVSLGEDRALFSTLRAALASEAASVAWSDSPVFGVSPEGSFRLPATGSADGDRIAVRSVSERYFSVTGIPLLSGRAPRVAIWVPARRIAAVDPALSLRSE